jgi:hypothetical protein
MVRVPPLDTRLAVEIERVCHLEAAGLDVADAEWLLDRAHDAMEAELERREAPRGRFDCLACGASGTHEVHRLDCVFYRGWLR